MKHISIVSGITFIVLFSIDIVEGAIIRVPADYSTIQAGIDAAGRFDTVLVADGTYKGAGNRALIWNANAKHITVKSASGWNHCIIDCENESGGFYFNQTNQNGFDVIEGFTIRNGAASDDSSGGIKCLGASPTIKNCAFSDNHHYDGGGIACMWSSPSIINCRFIGNSATHKGGAVFCLSSSPTITGCMIGWNSSDDGAGIGCENLSSLEISGCTITYNTSFVAGGGIHCSDRSDAVISNCAITWNTSNKSGGGIRCGTDAQLQFIACTAACNKSYQNGGGIDCGSSSRITINCSIIWSNTAARYGNELSVRGHGMAVLFYSDVDKGQNDIHEGAHSTLEWGAGMIEEDPLFVSKPDGQFYLSHRSAGQDEDSPCIDAGGDFAENICYTHSGRNICMNLLTTGTDGAEDTGIADMGYHYIPACYATPTQNPSPTATPTYQVYCISPESGEEITQIECLGPEEDPRCDPPCMMPPCPNFDVEIRPAKKFRWFHYPGTETYKIEIKNLISGLQRTEIMDDFELDDGICESGHSIDRYLPQNQKKTEMGFTYPKDPFLSSEHFQTDPQTKNLIDRVGPYTWKLSAWTEDKWIALDASDFIYHHNSNDMCSAVIEFTWDAGSEEGYCGACDEPVDFFIHFPVEYPFKREGGSGYEWGYLMLQATSDLLSSAPELGQDYTFETIPLPGDPGAENLRLWLRSRNVDQNSRLSYHLVSVHKLESRFKI